MRPVELQSPLEPNGQLMNFVGDYRKAKLPLTEQLGCYCSFCETPAPLASLEVEHILPKKIYPDSEFVWENFLLACRNCNATKGVKDTRRLAPYLPHTHNLLCYVQFQYGQIRLKSGLSNAEQRGTEAFIELVGLAKVPTTENYLEADDRWEKRLIAYEHAKKFKDSYSKNPELVLPLIIADAQESGFFAIWFFVFADFPPVRAALLQAFKGTAISAFNAQYEPVER